MGCNVGDFVIRSRTNPSQLLRERQRAPQLHRPSQLASCEQNVCVCLCAGRAGATQTAGNSCFQRSSTEKFSENLQPQTIPSVVEVICIHERWLWLLRAHLTPRLSPGSSLVLFAPNGGAPSLENRPGQDDLCADGQSS